MSGSIDGRCLETGMEAIEKGVWFWPLGWIIGWTENVLTIIFSEEWENILETTYFSLWCTEIVIVEKIRWIPLEQSYAGDSWIAK